MANNTSPKAVSDQPDGFIDVKVMSVIATAPTGTPYVRPPLHPKDAPLPAAEAQGNIKQGWDCVLV